MITNQYDFGLPTYTHCKKDTNAQETIRMYAHKYTPAFEDTCTCTRDHVYATTNVRTYTRTHGQS